VELLEGLDVVPCPLFVGARRRAVLYAAAGADALEVRGRCSPERPLLIRREDAEVFRSAVAAALPRVLVDARRPPPHRSRLAYAMTTHLAAPLFAPRSRVARGDLVAAGDAVAAVLRALLDDEDLLWSMVATMQRHLQTHTHALNTAVYAAALGRAVFGAGADLRDVGRGALLHDIGKSRVPERILDKPGPLDAEEWRVMRTHPRVGYDIIVSTLGSVPSYAHIVLEHHERADGSGYPAGRLGPTIGLDSQVVAIADVFDALTSDRPYKAADPPFEALRIMRFEMAGQFDSDLLRAFIFVIGERDRFRRVDYRSLGAASARVLGRRTVGIAVVRPAALG
jgi:putative nucleotidyltransferase with HDIG domain